MIKSVLKAFSVLEYIASDPENPKLIGDISKALGIPVPTCGHMLQTLVHAGYLEQPSAKQGFQLGVKAYSLASKGIYRRDLVLAAQAKVEKLAEKLGETVILACLQRGRRTMLLEIKGDNVIQVRSDVFQIDDIYETATGRLLMSWLSPKELSVVLERYGLPGKRWKEASTGQKLHEQLCAIRENGHVVIRHPNDVVYIAYPVMQDEKAVAAVGIYMPGHRFAGKHEKAVHSGLKELSVMISNSIS